jgi:hypothetical protein
MCKYDIILCMSFDYLWILISTSILEQIPYDYQGMTRVYFIQYFYAEFSRNIVYCL